MTGAVFERERAPGRENAPADLELDRFMPPKKSPMVRDRVGAETACTNPRPVERAAAMSFRVTLPFATLVMTVAASRRRCAIRFADD